MTARKSAAAPPSTAAASVAPKESATAAVPLTISKIKPISKTIRRNASAANAP
jgi:hypothetical protein